MYKSCLVAIVAAACLCALPASAQTGPYPFGDEPYRLDWYPDPATATGCLKWNWQQHHWDNYCPVVVQPKAYMYPRARAVVVRAKG
ncbi:hypothetical protein [Bradyrhizobium sp. DOA9]|uniref:hypothetical protein n=1 Tax=Bradyrhizobium sp. DOA9 TaxID=1126627 RepID=UPI0005A60FC2|nr:hypothetical protein [Bradyrhizobium sp. DOA9]